MWIGVQQRRLELNVAFSSARRAISLHMHEDKLKLGMYVKGEEASMRGKLHPQEGVRSASCSKHVFGAQSISRREHRQFSIQSNPNPDTEDLLP